MTPTLRCWGGGGGGVGLVMGERARRGRCGTPTPRCGSGGGGGDDGVMCMCADVYVGVQAEREGALRDTDTKVRVWLWWRCASEPGGHGAGWWQRNHRWQAVNETPFTPVLSLDPPSPHLVHPTRPCQAVNELEPDAKRARIQQLHLAATVRPGAASAGYPGKQALVGAHRARGDLLGGRAAWLSLIPCCMLRQVLNQLEYHLRLHGSLIAPCGISGCWLG